jgi:hypothetical protein
MKASLSRWSTLIVIASLAMGCANHRSYNLPPAERLMEPGPGVGGPGPGVIPPGSVMGTSMAMPMGPMVMGPMGMGPEMIAPCGAVQTNVQMLFARPEGMQIRWDVGGHGYFDSEPLVVPGRYSFPQGGIYRLKVTNVEGREGVELYPTLEVGPVTPRTEAYLAHNAVPIQFTAEDFDQVSSGNFVTKVIYLPDPEFQELALAGVETLVSTRLDPGIDPIVEADRRGAILAIIRIGNKDLEMPGAEGELGGVMPAGAMTACGPEGACGPGMAGGGGAYSPGMVMPYGNVPTHLSGVTVPQWGMPITGTPIGLPGPPHIPLGTPAGLQKHVMRNHTPIHMPQPVKKFKIDVRQQPGYSYPAPPTRMHIREQMIHPPIRWAQPHHAAQQMVQ